MVGTEAPAPHLQSLWSSLSAAQRSAFLRGLSPDVGTDDANLARSKRTPLDTTGAEAVCFVATVLDGDKVIDKSHVGQTLWFKGHNGAKGPRGGVYCYGRCSVGPQKSAQLGMLKISQRAFEQLRQGGSAEGWVRFDGADRDVLVGVLSAFQARSL